MTAEAMPQRFSLLIESVSVLFASIAAMFASAAAVLPDLQNDAALLDDGKMRLVCITGALFGSLISVLVFPPKNGTARVFGIKIVTSSLVSVVFTPLAFHWQTIPRNTDTVLVASAVVAIIGVGAIRMVKPRAERALGNRLLPSDDKEGDGAA